MQEDLKNKSEKDLRVLLLQRQDELRDFRFRVAKGKAKNVKKGRNLRREIARILTALKKS